MCAVTHAVRRQRGKDGANYFLPRVHIAKREGLGRRVKAIQVRLELENAVLVDPKPFPTEANEIIKDY